MLKSVISVITVLSILISCMSGGKKVVSPPTQADKLVTYKSENSQIKISGLIFKDSELPMQEFLKDLASGKLSSSLEKLKITYTPSNIDNQIFSEIYAMGYLPVFVKIENQGNLPLQFSEKNLLFCLADNCQTPLDPMEGPRVISHIIERHLKKIGVDATFVSGRLLMVFGIGLLITAILPLPSLSGSIGGSLPNDKEREYTPHEDLQKPRITEIEYQDYLISQQTLAANSSISGLIFIKLENLSPDSDPYLIFKN